MFDRLLILDVNAPRDEIEELREEVDDVEVVMFQMDDENIQPKQPQALDHPIGQMLDICLLKLLKFFDDKFRPLNCSDDQRLVKNRFFKTLIHIFDEVLLPTHNTHHVQFVFFYYVEDGAKDEKVTLKCMRKSVAWNYFEMSAATQVSNLCSKICKKVETQEIS